MISRQAQEFWSLLKSAPKQIWCAAPGMASVDATAFIAAGMQHVFPIWAGVFPEADAAIALIGSWVQARTVEKGAKVYANA